MKNLSFYIFFVGLIGIVWIILFMPSKEINEYSDIENLNINTKIILSGNVSQLMFNEGFSILKIKDILIVCRGCDKNYLWKNVFIEGRVTEYEHTKEVTAFIIKIRD